MDDMEFMKREQNQQHKEPEQAKLNENKFSSKLFFIIVLKMEVEAVHQVSLSHAK